MTTVFCFITESVSSVEGSRNRRRRRRKKNTKYHGESGNVSDDNYRSSGFSEPSTQTSSDISFLSTSTPCTNGEDSKSKNGSSSKSGGSSALLSKQSNPRSLSNSVPNKTEHSASKDATSLNGSP